MSKKLLAACLAALSLGACQPAPATATAEASPRSTPSAPSAPSAPAVAMAPVTPVTPPTLVQDAAVVDPLALAHDAPKADHLAISRDLALEGDVKGALTEARRALYSVPDDEDALAQIAKLGRKAGAAELSAEAWGRLAALHPDDAVPLVQRGRALLALKYYRAAATAGLAASRVDPENPEAYQVTGLAQLGADQLDKAIGSFEKVVALSPNHGWALNDLGFAYLRAGENVRAVEALERAAALLPEVAVVQNNLGVALERVGATDAAKRAFGLATDLSPKYVKAKINAARLAKVQLAPTSPLDVSDTLSDIPADAHPLPHE